MIAVRPPPDLVRPPRLPLGGVVGIVAPSSPTAALFPDRFQHAVRVLEDSLKVSVRVSPKVLAAPEGFRAGTGVVRAAMINDFLADSEIDAIIYTIGGFNSAEILPYINVAAARSRPRIFVGYSDASALLLGMQALAGWITFHGPMVMTQFGEFPTILRGTLEAFERAVRGGLAGTTLEDPQFWTDERLEWGTDEWRKRPRHPSGPGARSVWARGRGKGSGSLWGGNLETINLLFGTPYLTAPERIVLFWEATESEAYLPRIQRALTHLDQCGILARTEAMLVGRLPHAQPCDGVTLRQVVTQAAAAYDIPIIADLSIGHTDPLITLPIGTPVEVRVDGESAEIRFIDEAVSIGE
jgi:muramoyltetrapeptide carboxypeptidase